MPRIRKALLPIFLTFALLLLPGCWSAHELTDEFIILAVALDKSDKGVLLTLQGIRPETSGTSTSGQGKGKGTDSGSKRQPFFVLACEGASIQEALEGINRVAPRYLYGGHNQVIFIGEELAKSGIMPYLDYFARTHLSQDSTWLIIAKHGTGQELLTNENILAKYPSMALSEMIKKNVIHIPTLYDFLLNYHGESGSQVFSTAIINRNEAAPQDFQIEQLLLQSCSLMKGDQLQGYLPDQDGETYDWLHYGFHSASLSFTRKEGCSRPAIGTLLQGPPAKLKLSQNENGQLAVNLIVKVDFVVSEGCSHPLTTPSDITLLEQEISDALSVRIRSLFDKLQAEKMDVFNLAEKVHAYKPSLWKSVEANWPETFASLPIDIEVSCHFRNSGVISKNPGIRE